MLINALTNINYNLKYLSKISSFHLMTLILVLFSHLSVAPGHALAAETESTQKLQATQSQLRAQYQALTEQLKHNQFKIPLHINSKESNNQLTGEIFAVVDYPFSTVNTALNNSAHWCDVLILHINIKYCSAVEAKKDTKLTVYLGKKEAQTLKDAHLINFDYRTVASTSDYFALELRSKQGPMGTSDYRILVEATTLQNGRTFLHYAYSYQFGLTGKIGMQGYLSTIGKNKVGFTETGKDPSGDPVYIKGVRGIVERNTMRYYLAIDSYLATFSSQSNAMLEKRLTHWYNSNELYHRQLHEVERGDYMAMKQEEYLRQQSAP